jgi:hypothetical protein
MPIKKLQKELSAGGVTFGDIRIILINGDGLQRR